MLLITFAPMVSQLLAANAQPEELTAELCSAHAPAIERSGAHHSTPSTHSTEALAHLDDQACGYCHFFAHAPAISDVRAPATLDVPVRRSVAVELLRVERPASPFTHAQPRAPPVLV
ncbi:MFS transporter [Caballeronia fortuita]|uniref:MFS transporter n=2 Tax=Caballeronia fortuita TaxID=1777138 RepID=A0A158DL11_9BURK|nr:MFS transporter [Caballeronia fortuita]